MHTMVQNSKCAILTLILNSKGVGNRRRIYKCMRLLKGMKKWHVKAPNGTRLWYMQCLSLNPETHGEMIQYLLTTKVTQESVKCCKHILQSNVVIKMNRPSKGHGNLMNFFKLTPPKKMLPEICCPTVRLLPVGPLGTPICQKYIHP